MKILKKKLTGKISNKVEGWTKNFYAQLKVNLTSEVRNYSRKIGDRLTLLATGIEAIVGEDGLSASDVAGTLAANAMGDWIWKKIGQKAQQKLKENPEIIQIFATLKCKVRDLPRIIGEWANSADPVGFIGSLGKLVARSLPKPPLINKKIKNIDVS